MVKNYYRQVPGWFDFEDIYNNAVARAANGDVLVEIGSFMGKSMSYLAEVAFNSGKDLKLVAVDMFEITPDEGDGDGFLPWEAGITAKEWERQNGGKDALLNKFKDSIASTLGGDKVSILRGDSSSNAANFEDQSVFFAFIDAAHSYDAVTKDLIAWYPKIKKGGILAGHDYRNHLKRAVLDFAKTKGLNIQSSGASWFVYL